MKRTATTRLWLAVLTAMAMLAALAGPGWARNMALGACGKLYVKRRRRRERFFS